MTDGVLRWIVQSMTTRDEDLHLIDRRARPKRPSDKSAFFFWFGVRGGLTLEG